MNRIFSLLRRSPNTQLGPLEQQLLSALWMRGSATVREILDAGEIKLAYTTVMTTLDRLYKKQLLNRTAEGRAFRYSPRYTQAELEKAAVG
jgi:predicted transcriptional regulator